MPFDRQHNHRFPSLWATWITAIRSRNLLHPPRRIRNVRCKISKSSHKPKRKELGRERGSEK